MNHARWSIAPSSVRAAHPLLLFHRAHISGHALEPGRSSPARPSRLHTRIRCTAARSGTSGKRCSARATPWTSTPTPMAATRPLVRYRPVRVEVLSCLGGRLLHCCRCRSAATRSVIDTHSIGNWCSGNDSTADSSAHTRLAVHRQITFLPFVLRCGNRVTKAGQDRAVPLDRA